MRITVFGGGYVGLSSAAVLSKNHAVTVVDIDHEKIRMINEGVAPIVEEGLETLMKTALARGTLKAVDSNADFSQQDAVLICVDTPSGPDGSVDLSSIKAVTAAIEANLEHFLDDYLIIGVRSTVTPTTTRSLVLERFKSYVDAGRIGVIFQPEFLRQGYAIKDLEYPDRVIIGASDDHAYEVYRDIVMPGIEKENVPVFRMQIESAELCKYASNSFLATKISFVNELSSLAELLPNIDIDEVVAGMTADHRICPSHLRPGLGYGGSCLPKDVHGLLRFGENRGAQMRLLKAVHLVNQDTTERLIALISDRLPELKGKKVAVLGAAFKADTDDTRESPALPLIARLIKEGVRVHVHDPVVNLERTREIYDLDFVICPDLKSCLSGANGLVLMTDWDEYARMPLEELTAPMENKLVLDGRRMFTTQRIPREIDYRAIGTHHQPS